MKRCIYCGKTFGFLDRKYSGIFGELTSQSPKTYEKIFAAYGNDIKELCTCTNMGKAHGDVTTIFAITKMIDLYNKYGDLREGHQVVSSLMPQMKDVFYSIDNMQEEPLKTILLNESKNLRKHMDMLFDRVDSFSNTVDTFTSNLSDFINLAASNGKKINFKKQTFACDDDYLYCFYYGEEFISKLKDSKTINDMWKKLKYDKIIESYYKNPDQFVFKIKKDDILFYQEKGSLQYSTKVSGGGGESKDINISGAVVGGLLFGEVGAIIGSRKGTGIKIDEVKSETIKHDSRNVVLSYTDSEGKVQAMEFSQECYEIFMKLIPEKDISVVNALKEETQTEKKLPFEELKQLKELLDLGIITESEFEIKKQQLLGI